jgi:hypothetical protein
MSDPIVHPTNPYIGSDGSVYQSFVDKIEYGFVRFIIDHWIKTFLELVHVTEAVL